ncbi:MAG: inositol monophosphatase family protein, partial [candidate division WOR-3 bacterium]
SPSSGRAAARRWRRPPGAGPGATRRFYLPPIAVGSEEYNIPPILLAADKESEEFIISSIENKYPGVEIIAEETKPESNRGKEAFIIDPLDGTNNFSYGIPVFSISLAYQSEDSLEIGVVYDPVHKELFYAEKGQKAFLNDSPISVSKRNSLSDSILATGFPYIKKTENCLKKQKKIQTYLNFHHS